MCCTVALFLERCKLLVRTLEWSAATDFFLALIPRYMLWNLSNLKKKEIITVCMSLSLGVFYELFIPLCIPANDTQCGCMRRDPREWTRSAEPDNRLALWVSSLFSGPLHTNLSPSSRCDSRLRHVDKQRALSDYHLRLHSSPPTTLEASIR